MRVSRCEKCGSSDFDVSRYEADEDSPGMAWTVLKCSGCKHEWKEIGSSAKVAEAANILLSANAELNKKLDYYMRFGVVEVPLFYAEQPKGVVHLRSFHNRALIQQPDSHASIKIGDEIMVEEWKKGYDERLGCDSIVVRFAKFVRAEDDGIST